MIGTRDGSQELRIVSDGSRGGTFVQDAEGRRVKNVTKVRWEIGDETGRAEAQIWIADVRVDVTGTLTGGEE